MSTSNFSVVFSGEGVFGRFFSIFLAGSIAFCFCSSFCLAEPPEVAGGGILETDKKVAVIRLGGYVTEGPGLTALSLSGVATESISEIAGRITLAAGDDDISAVLLSVEQPVISWAQVDELRTAFAALRTAGKSSYAYAESIGQLQYLLCCACDEIAITPTGSLMLTGLSGRVVYLKELLAKLGIRAEIMQAGRYKAAAETFTRSWPSEYEIDQMNRLMNGLYAHLVKSIAASRKLSVERVCGILDQGPFTAAESVDFGLIDHIMYRDEFIAYLGEKLSGPISLEKNYGRADSPSLMLDNPFAMMGILQQLISPPRDPAGDAIAVVYVDGPIVLGASSESIGGNYLGARTIRMALSKAASDGRIKGIVLRVESPGGSATASDIIYRAVSSAAGKKPLVVSLGSVAASGGYYIACGGPTIMAQAGTITGSIGVVSGKFVVDGLLDKLGIRTYGFSRGRNAEMFSPTRPFLPLERLKNQSHMDQTYQSFKRAVSQSRGERLAGPIESLAAGRVYTGREALSLGLIDRIGGLDDAIRLTAQQAGLEDYNIKSLPEPKGLIELLAELLADRGPAGDETVAISGLFGHSSELDLGLVQFLSHPIVRRLTFRISAMLKILEREQMLLVMPYEFLLD